MKIIYDPHGDRLQILFGSAPIEHTSTELPGMTLDFDGGGRVVSLELIDVSLQMHDPRTVQFLEVSSLASDVTSEAAIGDLAGKSSA